jgi:septal ring-binding cell division protein DamX
MKGKVFLFLLILLVIFGFWSFAKKYNIQVLVTKKNAEMLAPSSAPASAIPASAEKPKASATSLVAAIASLSTESEHQTPTVAHDLLPETSKLIAAENVMVKNKVIEAPKPEQKAPIAVSPVKHQPQVGEVVIEPTVTQPEAEKASLAAHYVLQIKSGPNKKALLDFVKASGLSEQIKCIKTSLKGKDWYFLAYGQYQTEKEAKAAKKQIGPEIKKFNPWIRPIHAGDQVQ